MYIIAAAALNSRVHHTAWAKPRPQIYWEAAKAGMFGDEWWYDHL